MLKKHRIASILPATTGLGLSTLIAAPAFAAERSFGFYACPVDVALSATTKGSTYIYVAAGGRNTFDTFTDNGGKTPHFLYSGFSAVSYGYISAPGSIIKARYTCDD